MSRASLAASWARYRRTSAPLVASRASTAASPSPAPHSAATTAVCCRMFPVSAPSVTLPALSRSKLRFCWGIIIRLWSIIIGGGRENLGYALPDALMIHEFNFRLDLTRLLLRFGISTGGVGNFGYYSLDSCSCKNFGF